VICQTYERGSLSPAGSGENFASKFSFARVSTFFVFPFVFGPSIRSGGGVCSSEPSFLSVVIVAV